MSANLSLGVLFASLLVPLLRLGVLAGFHSRRRDSLGFGATTAGGRPGPSRPRRVGVVGAGYMGLVHAAALASMGHQVVVYDIDQARIARLRRGRLPFFEAGLERLVEYYTIGRSSLLFTSDLASMLAQSEVVFICVGTPPAKDGHFDMSAFDAAAGAIIEAEKSFRRFQPLILVVKSTVPIGTGEKLQHRCWQARLNIAVVSSPDFLAEGTAVQDAIRPHKLVVGGSDIPAMNIVRGLFGDHVPVDRVVFCTNSEAELAKLANNALLSTRVVVMNELGNLAQEVGADIDVVARALGLDPRIGAAFLSAGPGYGGSCFSKDAAALVAQAGDYNLAMPLLHASLASNSSQQRLAGETLMAHFGGRLDDRCVAVLGVSFKPGTDDLRNSSSLVLIDQVLSAGGSVKAYDPLPTVAEQLQNQYPAVEMVDSPTAAVRAADVVAVMHPDLTKHLPLNTLAERPDRVIVDPRRAYPLHQVKMTNCTYLTIGRPHVVPPVSAADGRLGAAESDGDYRSLSA